MKIGIISESPLMATGFGVACDQFARQLSSRSWDVTCFGLGFTGLIGTLDYPYRIWLSGRSSQDFASDVLLFLEAERPEGLLLIGDIEYVETWSEYLLRQASSPRPIVAHVVADGLPVSRRYVAALRNLDGVMVATNALATHLQQEHELATHVVKQGVDLESFQPIAAQEKARLRQAMGLDGVFLVGVFGRNDERKQQPRVLQALHLLRDKYGQTDIRVYMHCQEVDEPGLRGWDLEEVAMQMDVTDAVIFPRHFNQLGGVARLRLARKPCDGGVSDLETLSYVERLALCDVVVNPAFSGGFELTTLEVQASGVPLLVTNDHSNIAEVAGAGAALMEGVFGLWPTGARQYLVDPEAIAQHILHLRDDAVYRGHLIKCGLENAHMYSWNAAGEQMATALAAMIACAS